MAFVFRSERNLNDSRQKSKSKDKIIENSKNLSLNLLPSLNDVSDKKNLNFNILNNEIQNNNNSFAFLSGEEKLKCSEAKEETPGPGTYNINSKYYQKNRNFSSMIQNPFQNLLYIKRKIITITNPNTT